MNVRSHAWSSQAVAVEAAVEAPDSRQDIRRRGILEAAARCFVESGFHGASMQQICAAAGMSPGALYRYFPSKDAIVRAIITEERGGILEMLGSLEPQGSLVDTLMEYGLAFVRYKQRPGATQLMLEVAAESMRNPAFGALFAEHHDEVCGGFVAMVEAAKARGEIAADLDAGAAIGVYTSLGEGLLIRTRLDPSLTIERLRPMLRDVLVSLFPPPAAMPGDAAKHIPPDATG